MYDLLKTSLVLIFIVILLRRKVSMTAVMPIGAILLGLLYLTPPAQFFKAALRGIIAPASLEMTITLMLTMVMENILRTSGMLKRMVGSLSAALRHDRPVAVTGRRCLFRPNGKRGSRRGCDQARAESAD